jgi:hypothetical protein
VIWDVDRLNPNRILISQETPSGTASVRRSDDGGETFTEIMEVPSLGEVRFSEDGKTIWIGSPQGQLYRVKGAGDAERMAPEATFTCLFPDTDRLLACGDNWIDDFALGESTDMGKSFRPWVRLQDARSVVSCDDPMVETTCEAEWQEWQVDILRPADLRAVNDAGPRPDAGPSMRVSFDAKAANGNCACGIAGAQPTRAASPFPLASLLTLAAVALRRRWRFRG